LSVLFRKANASSEGFRLVVDGGDPDDLCPSKEVLKITNLCALLCQAYIFAKNHMSTIPGPDCRRWRWSECCDAACKHLNPSGNTQVTNEASLRQIHASFVKKEMFPVVYAW
jgi:hypothetical protein